MTKTKTVTEVVYQELLDDIARTWIERFGFGFCPVCRNDSDISNWYARPVNGAALLSYSNIEIVCKCCGVVFTITDITNFYDKNKLQLKQGKIKKLLEKEGIPIGEYVKTGQGDYQ